MNKSPLTPDQRGELAEKIYQHVHHLGRVSEAYLQCSTHAIQVAFGQPAKDRTEASDAFLELIESAGRMTSMHLEQLGTLLEILQAVKEPAVEPPAVMPSPGYQDRTFFKGSFE